MPLDYEKLMATEVVDLPLRYDDSEAILYALSVGMGRDPLDLKELPYVFEQGGMFKTLPTLATCFHPDLAGTSVRCCTQNSACNFTAHCPPKQTS